MPLLTGFDLTGRVAAVTGGNSGIGKAIASGLAQAGAAVAIMARNEERNVSTLRELQGLGGRAAALKVDVCAPRFLEAGPGRGRATTWPDQYSRRQCRLRSAQGIARAYRRGLGFRVGD
jgi:NAD(P)-dependent dehydrogenase (short-subunit alcohol dehydrogenase family)